MTSRDVVLVVADATDPTADRVCATLAARAARFFRFDTADIPQRLRLRAELGTTSWHGELVTAEDRVNLDEVGAVYVRRPRAFEPPTHLSAIEQWHSAIECRYALGGILASLNGVRWCNMPAHSADAAYKPKQLRDFRACGLATPPTVITNDAQAVRDFAALRYRVIDTPPDIRAGVAAYLKMAGLAFGAFDFGVTAEGWWVYECNAEGQIGWLEAETGIPISEAIADFLVGGPES